jgi:hypothetical protein
MGFQNKTSSSIKYEGIRDHYLVIRWQMHEIVARIYKGKRQLRKLNITSEDNIKLDLKINSEFICELDSPTI